LNEADLEIKARVLALDKIISHLTRATKMDTRSRERRRAQIALKHINRFLRESREEVRLGG